MRGDVGRCGEMRGDVGRCQVEEGLARAPEHLARADRDHVGLAHGVVRVVLEARLAEDGALLKANLVLVLVAATLSADASEAHNQPRG